MRTETYREVHGSILLQPILVLVNGVPDIILPAVPAMCRSSPLQDRSSRLSWRAGVNRSTIASRVEPCPSISSCPMKTATIPPSIKPSEVDLIPIIEPVPLEHSTCGTNHGNRRFLLRSGLQPAPHRTAGSRCAIKKKKWTKQKISDLVALLSADGRFQYLKMPATP
ncbi:MAG: hypothetical protein PWQ89_1635 [Verrucomicrobiota bacterium]|nr:hypothetical protein [Verrucomicrobiota bacterium]